jgi:hypothetical protein
MAELAKIHTDRLKELKKIVEESQQYFSENVKRFEKFIKFVFKSSLNDDEAATLAANGKPTIEFNILESFISRLRGEFAKQQPNLQVRAADGVPLSMLTPQFTETLSVIEAHLRAIFFDGANDMLDYNVYSDLLAGGFSVLRVYTEYVNELSFEQNICVERVFDPTLTVFDPLARKSHKGDGRFCAELYPMTRKSFEDEFGEDVSKNMKFTRSLSGFDWSFQNEKEEIVLVCDYYEKKTRRETIYKLSNGHSVTKKEYEKFLQDWDEAGYIEQPPVVIKQRKTLVEYICRYRFCESRVLDYVETDYKYLPLVFVDGNSVMMKDGASYVQMTRPWCWHAEGIQRLKNYAGQSLANELENTIQHKFIVAIESVPEDYQSAYQNIQKADTLMYNHFLDTNNPQVVLPPPREVNRTPIPPEITNTFKMSDEMTQTILGSYDTAQGVNQAQLSGIAFARSAIQSNNSSMPYVVGYIKGLNRIAQIIIDLIPKYYRTPRSLPILLPNGKRSYKEINKKGSLYMNFDPNMLQVKVDTGVNFAMQKEIALQTIIAMSQANQGFAQFFNEEGLPTLLENIEIRGIDQLKMKAEAWMEKQKQQQAQAQQMAMQQQQMQAQQMQQQAQAQAQQQQMQMAMMQKELQSPSEGDVGAMLVQQKAQNDAANTAIKARDSETKFLETLAKIRNENVDRELKAAEIEAENERTSVESALKLSQHITSMMDKGISDETKET